MTKVELVESLRARGYTVEDNYPYLDVKYGPLGIILKGDYPDASGSGAMAEIRVTANCQGDGYWLGHSGGEYDAYEVCDEFDALSDIDDIFQPGDRETVRELIQRAEALLAEIQPIWAALTV